MRVEASAPSCCKRGTRPIQHQRACKGAQLGIASWPWHNPAPERVPPCPHLQLSRLNSSAASMYRSTSLRTSADSSRASRTAAAAGAAPPPLAAAAAPAALVAP